MCLIRCNFEVFHSSKIAKPILVIRGWIFSVWKQKRKENRMKQIKHQSNDGTHNRMKQSTWQKQKVTAGQQGSQISEAPVFIFQAINTTNKH